ncbi:hypothetical protein [Butyrivibrio sp. INlla14]|uniref:hypothetical protein n=1 Tax=Butyrivibrio sp. INlla14 TaxID=1520808 RepID=UPI0008772E42|nr:hypothetical protein [Butyrivibrio sp. INlla14]SCX82733.1 hypothetical protein SAMN02910371_00088 [Butyrivibrio sp. INlla14]
MDELRTKLLHEIMGIYGPNQGQSIGAVIIPAFVSDFKSVVEKSDSPDEVTEEYMTEDKRIHLVLCGRKTLGKKGYSTYVTDARFNGKRLFEGANELHIAI